MNADERINVVIIGLGYVGLTLGVALARRGVQVLGVERRADVVDLTNRGIPHFSEVGLDVALASVVANGRFKAVTTTEEAPPANYYIITVGTPLRAGSTEPRLDMIEMASRQVAEHMEDGATVILRSTVRIGTTRDVVKRVLDSANRQYYLSMCPERTLEGDALRELATLPQIIGGLTDGAADRAASLFSRLTNTIVRVSDPETAEMIKLVDNTSRDVRFAFANEVARACDAIGINAQEVIRFGKLGYSRTDVALPGLVGGPCLEKDPHILLASLAPKQVDLEITAAARKVNERQPKETIAAVIDRLPGREEGGRIAVVAGLAFKGIPETDDLRGAMSLKVIEELEQSQAFSEIRVYDSVVSIDVMAGLPFKLTVFDDLYAACLGADLVVITNNHAEFSAIEVDRLLDGLGAGGVIYDYWNTLAEQPAEVLRGRYITVGNMAGKF
ncbi:MAG: nucleotide sugar dehydrogenase [Novosphingobium sp.]